jgi:hypothetical protein
VLSTSNIETMMVVSASSRTHDDAVSMMPMIAMDTRVRREQMQTFTERRNTDAGGQEHIDQMSSIL